MELIEECIVHTFDMLFDFQKWEDLQGLLDPMCSMLISFRRNETDKKQNLNATEAQKASNITGKGGMTPH